KRAYCLKTQPATGETYPKSDLFNKAPSLRQSGSVVEVEQPLRGKYLTVGCPMKFSAFTPDIKAAPLLGEHTAAVLQELGYSDDEIAAMKQNHAI
ncbi:hypothetical protein MZE82_00005, partial [Escherichia coli]|nr:hypothetical protein [Escherichia coli]